MTRWVAMGLLLLAVSPAHAAGLVDFVGRVSGISLLDSTPREVAAAADVAVGICGEAEGSRRPIEPKAAATMFLPLPPQCDGRGEVVGLQIRSVAAPPDAMARIATVLRPEFGAPCYTGRLTSDPRRRALPPFATIWAHGTRILAVTRDTPETAQATVLYADLSPRSIRFATVVDTIARGLPAACLAADHG